MAVQDNKKVIGDKPGFVVPQKGVNFNPNQNNQGGSGGAASSANPSGLSKKPNEYKPPASARYNAATEDPIGISNKLEAGAKAVSDLPKTIGSTLIGAAKGTGNAIVGAGVGLANMAASDGSMRPAPKYNVGDVKNKIGSIVDSAITPSNYTSVVTNGLSRMGLGSKESAPSEIISDRQNEVASQPISQTQTTQQTPPVQLGGKLNNELNGLSPISSDVVSEGVAKGEFARSSGGTTYARSNDGSIFRKGTYGSLSKLGGISSIGPNGTNSDGSPLSARDQAALDRSNQMVSDWKAQKERASYQKIIDTELSKPFRNTRLIGEATDKLTALDTNDTNRAQISSQADIQARTLGATARKNAFEEQLNTQKLGVDLAKASSEAQGRSASQQNDTFKLIGEVDKNLGSTQDKVAVYKSRGMWNPLTIKASYPREKLGSFKTPDELRQNLVNDESIDQGDIEDIVFSYFPNNQ